MVWTSIQTFGNQIVGFLVSIILSRLLLPAEFGLIGMIGIFMGISGALINSGLGASLIRTDAPSQADYSTVFVFNMLGSMILYIVMFLAAPFISDFFEQPLLVSITRLYCSVFVINAFSAVQVTRLHKLLDFKTETTASLTANFSSAIVGIVLAYLGFGVMSLVWMAIAAAVVNNVMLWVQSGWKPSLIFHKAKFRYHFGFGSRMMAAGILDIIFNNVYVLIIGKFYSATQLGLYNRADSLKQYPVSTLSSILSKVTYPLFAEVKNDNERLKSIYKQILRMVIFIIGPVLALMGVLAEPMFRFLFTDKWLPAVPYFQILLINGLLFPLHSNNIGILSVKGRSDLILRLEIMKKVLLTLILVASFSYGIYGLLWGQVLFSIIAFFINTHFSGKFIGYNSWQQLRDVIPPIFLSASMAYIVFIIDSVISSQPDFWRLLIGGLGGVIFFLTFAIVLRFETINTIVDLANKKLPFSIPYKIK